MNDITNSQEIRLQHRNGTQVLVSQRKLTALFFSGSASPLTVTYYKLAETQHRRT